MNVLQRTPGTMGYKRVTNVAKNLKKFILDCDARAPYAERIFVGL